MRDLDRIDIRDKFIKEIVDMIIVHRKNLQHNCFAELSPESCVNQITGEMFCDMDDMLGTFDKYRQREEW